MQAIGFYIIYALLWLIAWLPLCILYILADILYFPLYYFVRYRVKVVRENLQNAFPGKSREELRVLEKKFYHHLSHIMMEIIRMIHISPAELEKRITYENPSILDEFYEQGKQVMVVVAHYGNWEWLAGLPGATSYHTLSVYKPLNNPYFNQLMKNLRERNGTRMVQMKRVVRVMKDAQEQKRLTMNCFISDQSPVWEEVQYWTPFLNQDTPVYLGIEKLAVRFNMPVLFFRMIRIRRGHYKVRIIPLVMDPSTCQPHEITDKHVRILEQIIREQPEYWLWSHRRWKLTKRKQAEWNAAAK